MAAQATLQHTIEHLKVTLEAAKLPSSQRDRGETLLTRLTSAVRLSLIGLPGSGKSELINLLAGETVLTPELDRPTTEIVWGETARARLVSSDGSETDLSWPLSGDEFGSDAVFLKVELSVPVLKETSFLEVVTDGSPEDLSSALNWTIPRTDIAIWCTQAFGRLEDALWVQVPDSLKDHGFLVMTKADAMSVHPNFAKELARLSRIGSEEFRNFFAVSTTRYNAARARDGAVTDKVRAATGGGAILDAITGHIAKGKAADMDAAFVFLSRFGVPFDPAAASTDVAATEPELSPPALDAEHQVGAILGASAQQLGDLDVSDQGLPDAVLDICMATLEKAVDDAANDPGIPQEIATDIENAYEQVVLMQLEQSIEAAADAVTILAQLKSELELAQAA